MKQRRAFTLLELLLAVGMTGCIGLGIAGMMSALSQGVVEQHDARSSMLRAGMTHARVSSYLSRARCLLDLESDRMVCWLEDADGDDAIDATEVRWFAWNPATGRLQLDWIVDPSGNILEDPYGTPTGVDWWAELTALSANQSLRRGTLGLVSGLQSWNFDHDNLLNATTRREAAMLRRAVTAGYALDVSGATVEHCMGESIRMHDPPSGGPS